jgi:hypothetical protein
MSVYLQISMGSIIAGQSERLLTCATMMKEKCIHDMKQI